MNLPRTVVLIASLSLLGPVGCYASSLNFSATAQQVAIATLTDAPVDSCIQSGGPASDEFPFACRIDTNGGHIISHIIGGGMITDGVLSGTYEFQGSGTVSIFPQPGADTKSAYASYSFQAVVAPLTSGDQFKFTLSDVSTCSNSLGSCTPSTVSVSGADTIKGKLAKGQTITATQPVTIDFVEAFEVSNLAPRWSETFNTTIDITPVSEAAPRRTELARAFAIDDPVATPEPGSLGLLAVAMGGLILWRRQPNKPEIR
jgi:hypothetical protein